MNPSGVKIIDRVSPLSRRSSDSIHPVSHTIEFIETLPYLYEANQGARYR